VLSKLLGSLRTDEWHLPTSSSQRNVNDVACQLLDGSLRRLSMQRDGYFPPDQSSRMRSGENLLDFLNRLNQEWEIGTRRLSPRVLAEQIAWADEQLAELFESLDPFGPAIFAVGWLGEEQSLNWMDVARDYTEKWHHTQQIFEATRRPSTITRPELFHPCLDTFMRALPYTYREVPGIAGMAVAVKVTGEAGGVWFVEHDGERWRQLLQPTGNVLSTVVLDQITLWKLVTKRRSRAASIAQFPNIMIEGDVDLGSHFLDMVSMMA
jgi:hypothetical protein